jgi:hypothetical protein
MGVAQPALLLERLHAMAALAAAAVEAGNRATGHACCGAIGTPNPPAWCGAT